MFLQSIGACVFIFIFALFAYVIKFYCDGESSQSTWGQFGDCMGGVVNPIAGSVTIIFLLSNLRQNEKLLIQSQDELRLAREELKRGQEIQRLTEVALSEQIKIAAYSRDLNNAIVLYENLEMRAEVLLKHNPAVKDAANQYLNAIDLKKDLNHILEDEHARLLKLYPMGNNLFWHSKSLALSRGDYIVGTID